MGTPNISQQLPNGVPEEGEARGSESGGAPGEGGVGAQQLGGGLAGSAVAGLLNTFQTYYQYDNAARAQDDWIRQIRYSTMSGSYGTSGKEYVNKPKEPTQEELEHMASINKRVKLANDFLIGCDPEFAVVNPVGQGINCDEYLSHSGEVGTDHSGWAIELRPEPTKGAYALVKRIQSLILGDWADELPSQRFKAGGVVQAESRLIGLGGHIHLDVNPYDEKGNLSAAHRYRVMALDAVTEKFEEMDILPQTECRTRRERTGYGKFGDVRIDTRYSALSTTGRKSRIEYRTMASWLSDPKVAMLCLTGAKLAVTDPEGTITGLKGANWTGVLNWLDRYKQKDQNALRLLEVVPDVKMVQVDPTVSFRSRWQTLGLGGK